MSHIFSVTDLSQALRDVLEAEFPFVWVRGQVTNCARPGSGHIYFSLADAGASLPVVWFRRTQGRGGASGVDPLTGEVLDPARDPAAELADGQEVLAAGRITAYAPRGSYQLVAELVQPSGVSDLALAFAALKRTLAERGWFEEARKRPLPPNPSRVAVVTSPQGAAVQDFLRLASERGTGCEIRIYPALVQGEAAPEQIARALEAVNAGGWAQVAALIRGGGSLEDLWAFNTEVVARAVFASAVPVATGIGHEPDVSIADYVADRRFATPSAVAVGLWPLRADLAQQVDGLEAALGRSFGVFLQGREERLAGLGRALAWLSPLRRLERLEEARRDALGRLAAAGERLLEGRRAQLEEALRRLAPQGGRLVESRRRELAGGVRGLDRAFGPQTLAERAGQVLGLARRAELAGGAALAAASGRSELLAARLAGLDPEGPLARGYALVRVERTGRFLRSTADVAPGDRLGVRTADGEVPAVVAAPVASATSAASATSEEGS